MLRPILFVSAILVAMTLIMACGGSSEGNRVIATLEGMNKILESNMDDCDALGDSLSSFVATNKKAIVEARGSLKVSESQKKTITKYRKKVLQALRAAEKKCADHPAFVSGYAALVRYGE